jgi:N utilization substance protein B
MLYDGRHEGRYPSVLGETAGKVRWQVAPLRHSKFGIRNSKNETRKAKLASIFEFRFSNFDLPMGSRRKSREFAMQMLYQWEICGYTPAQVEATFFANNRADADVEGFARDLFEGAVNDIDRLDHLVRKQADNWRLERMAAVDRNILRVALYELLCHPETPTAAVINEALEIAGRFSGEGSVEFVNGVLDGIRKTLLPCEPQSK